MTFDLFRGGNSDNRCILSDDPSEERTGTSLKLSRERWGWNCLTVNIWRWLWWAGWRNGSDLNLITLSLCLCLKVSTVGRKGQNFRIETGSSYWPFHEAPKSAVCLSKAVGRVSWTRASIWGWFNFFHKSHYILWNEYEYYKIEGAIVRFRYTIWFGWRIMNAVTWHTQQLYYRLLCMAFHNFQLSGNHH